MSFRTIEVQLKANIADFQARLGVAARSTREFQTELVKAAQEGNKAADMLGKGLVVAGGAGAVALGKAATVGMDFQKQMTGVLAVSGASADEMKRLEEAAIAAGSSTKLAGVTASDAAAAQAELVKAGVSVSEVLGGALTGSLTLAAAGQIDFANAATIAAQAMNIFDLSGSEVGHVADLLAAAANKSAADVGQLGDALKQGGLVAAQTGLDLEETTGALAAFADNALVGSDAGTSLKTMLQRLTPQSAEAAELMGQLGFSAYDAQGNFVGLEKLAGELRSSLGGLTTEQRNSAMATLFGSDAVRAANILYEQGAKGIADYVAAVDDVGAASRMAAIQNDNLAGDIEALGGAIETVMIQGAGQADDVLRGLTRTLTTTVTGFGELQGPLGGVATGLTVATTGASLLGGAALLAAPKIKQAKDALSEMGSAGDFASRNLGKLATGVTLASAAVGAGLFLYGKATESSREYQETVDQLAGSLAPVARGQADLNEKLREFLELQMSDLGEDQIAVMNALGVTLADIEDSIAAGGDALDPLRASVTALGQDLNGMDLGQLDNNADGRNAAKELGEALGFSADQVRGLIDAVEDWDNQAQDSARATLIAAVANGDLKQSAYDAAIEANKLAGGAVNYAAALRQVGMDAPKATTETKAFTDASQVAADPLVELEDAIKGVNDALRAQFDPLFAAQDALLANADAHRQVNEAHWKVTAAAEKYSEAVKREGEESWAAKNAAYELEQAKRDLEQADRDVVRSALDVAAAQNELRAKVEAGVVSLGDAESTMATWVEQGLITEEQAKKTAEELGMVAWNAAAAGSQKVEIPVKLTGYDLLLRQLREIPGYGAAIAISSAVRAEERAGRWGMVEEYARGGIATTPAHVAVGTRFKYAEPETGGEAFIPRLGDRGRSMGILRTAAGWYGAAVVPMARGGIIGGGGAATIDYARLAEALEARSVKVTIERGDRLDEAAVARIVRYLSKRTR